MGIDKMGQLNHHEGDGRLKKNLQGGSSCQVLIRYIKKKRSFMCEILL